MSAPAAMASTTAADGAVPVLGRGPRRRPAGWRPPPRPGSSPALRVRVPWPGTGQLGGLAPHGEAMLPARLGR